MIKFDRAGCGERRHTAIFSCRRRRHHRRQCWLCPSRIPLPHLHVGGMERPTGSSHAAFTMAGLVAAGGVTGYAKTRSVPSLVAGLGIASLYAAGGYQINVSHSWYAWHALLKHMRDGCNPSPHILPPSCRRAGGQMSATPLHWWPRWRSLVRWHRGL